MDAAAHVVQPPRHRIEHEEVVVEGKIAVVTGATSGIGKEIARGLAKTGATVIVGARSLESGEAVAREIGGRTTALRLDVASPRSVDAFAKELPFERVDVLVNNAGAWFTDRRETPEGRELTFATNVLGPFQLTTLLHPRLARAKGARVVNVVSAFAGNYDATDLDFFRRRFDGFKAYGQSKLALRMLTWGFAARYAKDGIAVNAVAPGFVRTNFNKNGSGFLLWFFNVMARFFADTPEKGAEGPIWAATAPELDGMTGKYFDRKKEKEGRFRDATAIEDLEARCARLLAGASARQARVDALELEPGAVR
jgi:NAD(P)-dependent dehydrogenase (short-subunit alcohol dehydrogenase family)